MEPGQGKMLYTQMKYVELDSDVAIETNPEVKLFQQKRLNPGMTPQENVYELVKAFVKIFPAEQQTVQGFIDWASDNKVPGFKARGGVVSS